MTLKTTRQIAQILLVVIGIVFLFTFFDTGRYFVSSHEHYQEMTDSDQKAKLQHLKFRNLQRISFYIKNQQNSTALTLLDSLISIDTLRIDLVLKRGFVHYKLNKRQRAKSDFTFVREKTGFTSGDQNFILDKKEQHYYALIGLMLIDSNFDKFTLDQYNRIKMKGYVGVSMDTIHKKLIFNVDSAISKQMYDVE
jgi:hypothetical protein